MSYRLGDETRRHAQAHPDRPALSCANVSRTFEQLHDRSGRFAALLADLGVGEGSRVAVLDHSSIEVVEVVLAAARLGAVTVPVNWRLTPVEIATVVTDAQIEVLVHGSAFSEAATVVVDVEPKTRLLVLDDGFAGALADVQPLDSGFTGDTDTVVLQLYTSGTTGEAKGVLITNRNLASAARSGGPWGFDESSVSLCAMPLFHVGGIGWLLVGMSYGAHTILIPGFDATVVLDTLEERRVTNAFLVPTVIRMLLQHPCAAGRDYSALRSLAYGSSPISLDTLRMAREVFSRPLYQLYGMTETTGAITQLDPSDHERDDLLTSAGRPYPWVELAVTDPLTGTPVRIGATGEIRVRSELCTSGYHGRPQETADLIDEDGWLRTGDIGRIGGNGYLYVTDRLKDLIITGGENVYPTEVETVLAAHPSVAQVAVLGVPDERWGEVIRAVVVPAPDAALGAAQLRAFAQERLANYKVPKVIDIVPALPVSATGKILKRELPREFVTSETSMDKTFYDKDHESFREVVAEFVKRQVADHVQDWDEAGIIDRDVWLAAGQQGILGLAAPAEYGGAGVADDYRYRCIVAEELSRAFAGSLASGFGLQDDIAIPYLLLAGTDEQKKRWLPRMVTGELIGAIAMTEPGTGSDLQGIRTAGKEVDGGWVINGTKTFITNGINADVVIVVVRTDPGGGSRGFSLLVVERGNPGFTRGRKLKKIGLDAQDTAELFFEDVFVPDENVLGEIGGGFGQLMGNLPLERLSIAVGATASAEAVLASTVAYVKERRAFGKRIADFQNTSFRLAEMSAEIDVAKAFLEKCVLALNAGTIGAVDAAKAKLWTTEMQGRVIDQCLQLHGGYGYMLEYPVARAFRDARIQRIYGGTSEIMKLIIGRDLLRE